MTSKPKRVRVVEVKIIEHGIHKAEGPCSWETTREQEERLGGCCLCLMPELSRRSAIAAARRFWAQFDVKVKIARAK